jgi:hypothetical protein
MTMSNAANIIVGWNGRGEAGGDIPISVGRDIVLNPQALQDFGGHLFKDVEHDLVVVCGAIAFADRLVLRRRGSGWPRSFHLTIAVLDLNAWKRNQVINSLQEALEYVTGDQWTFNFVSGGRRITVPQGSWRFADGPFVVLPFSDGLDSYLQWQLLKIEEPHVSPVRMQTSSRALSEARNRLIDAVGSARNRRVRFPVSLRVGNHAEPTYRTRTFLFFSMAALAAAKLGTTRVVIGENGVGALGPSLIPYGDECPHSTTHPAFTRRLSRFLNELLQTQIAFEHPQVFHTKGQVLARAINLGVKGWESTNSCVRDARSGLDGLPCGVCSGCLLRRTAIWAAGDERTGFFWEDLSAGSLDQSRRNRCGREATKNDHDIMHFGAHAMASLARLSMLSPEALVYQQAAYELVGPDGNLGQAAEEVHRLVGTYADEWRSFLNWSGGVPLLNVEQ